MALTRQAIATQQRSLALVEQRYRRGAASALDVERVRTMAEGARADLPLLVADGEALMNALAILAGEAPGGLDALLKDAGPTPLPPASVAVGDPAAMLRRRPDVRAAERRLAAETARIGVAEAARFPSLRLLGLVGLGGTNLSDIADLDRLTAIAAPTLQWNFLDFGRAKARVRQAEAARDEAEANYRAAVLGALRDAEDSLARFGRRRTALIALARAGIAAERSAQLMRQRYEAGTVSMIDFLDAERQRIAAEQRLAAGRADLAADFIALQKALGLGWSASS
jgi:NodT family efflux transporter outer membrane factor (OMF) lipoprotein